MCTTLGYVDLEQPLQATWVDIDQSWIPWNIGKKMRPLGHHFTIQEIIPKMAQLICSFFAPKVLEPIPSRLRLLASQGCETEPTSKSWFLGTQNCRDSGQKKWNSKDLYVIYVISMSNKTMMMGYDSNVLWFIIIAHWGAPPCEDSFAARKFGWFQSIIRRRIFEEPRDPDQTG